MQRPRHTSGLRSPVFMMTSNVFAVVRHKAWRISPVIVETRGESKIKTTGVYPHFTALTAEGISYVRLEFRRL